MLAGAPPFSGETALSVAVQHLKTQPKPLETIRPDLPPALCRLVHSMLVKTPDRRCASAREIVREVRRLQLEYGGEDLPEDLPGWDSLSSEFPADPRIAATRQLGELMKTLSMRQSKKKSFWRYAAVLTTAFLLGGLIAWFGFGLANRSLLAGAEPQQTFPTASSAARQYLVACRFGTAEAWKSVIRNFPNDPKYTPRAKEQLVLLYLDKGDPEHALDVADDLIKMGSAWPEYEAFGWAGRSVALLTKRQYEASAQALNNLADRYSKLTNPLMKQFVELVIQKNRPNLGNLKTNLQWEKWDKILEPPQPETN
jgi:eukaryotic-like serine/threonine-protein kinase